MNTDISEYLDQPSSSGPDKKFRLERALDPETQKILIARMSVATDRTLSFGARNFFTLLLDLALDPTYHQGRRGQVAMSNTQLRERLNASARAIYGWTRQLESQLHIWLSKLPRPNTHAMNVFHVTALQPKKFHGPELPGDGSWGNGYRRPAQPMPKGARGGTCKKHHYLVDQFGNPLFAQNADSEPGTRTFCAGSPQNLRETPEKKDMCHPQHLRETPAKKDTSHPQNLRGAPAKTVTSDEQERAVLRESLVGVRDSTEVKGSLPPENLAAWEKKIKAWFPRELEKAKADLLKAQKESDPGDNAAIAELSLRIEAIDRALYGGNVPRKAAKPQARPARPTADPKQPTEEEILDGARYLVSLGKEASLTKSQRAALAKAAK